MEEVDGDFENLIIIDFHHDEDVLETHVTNTDCFFVAGYSPLQPFALNIEEFRVEIGYCSGKHLKDIAIFLFYCIEHLLHLLFLVCDGNKIVQLFGDSLQHEEILSLRVLICPV